MTDNLLFIAPAYNEQPWQIPFIDSMIAQRDTGWDAVVFHNGPSDTMRTRIAVIGDSRLQYEESSSDSGQWGTMNRATAIRYIAENGYIVQTSVQDYWLPHAVQMIRQQMATQPSIITWDSINHLTGPGVLQCELAWSKVDWGNFALRVDIAKELGIQRPTEFCSDWYTIQEGLNRGYFTDRIHIPFVLTIHN